MENISRSDFLKTAGIGLAGLAFGGGCVSKLSENLSLTPAQRREYATVEEAMEVLGVRDPTYITSINGYQMRTATASELRAHVEILAGEEGFSREYTSGDGFVGWQYTLKKQQILDRLLWKADPDGNMVIDEREIWNAGKEFGAGNLNQRR